MHIPSFKFSKLLSYNGHHSFICILTIAVNVDWMKIKIEQMYWQWSIWQHNLILSIKEKNYYRMTKRTNQTTVTSGMSPATRRWANTTPDHRRCRTGGWRTEWARLQSKKIKQIKTFQFQFKFRSKLIQLKLILLWDVLSILRHFISH